MTSNREFAPAKINLALHVTRRRPDGFHELESLFVFAQISDEILVEPASSNQFVVKGLFGGSIPQGEDNLVLKAVAAFKNRWPDAVPQKLAIELTKNLPVAAGIGSGSADAAATLRLLTGLSKVEIESGALHDVALGLGADVPACLSSVPSLVSGIGEIIVPVKPFPGGHIVLINSLVPISTPDVFGRLRRTDNSSLPKITKSLEDVHTLATWLKATRNDLAAPAIEIAPIIAEISSDLAKMSGCLIARMSGSGATVFGLYASVKEAEKAKRKMTEKWPDAWIASAPLIAAS